MNNTNPSYSQFIQKPIYVALGMLGNLGEYAKDLRILNENNINILTTTNNPNMTSYLAILFFSNDIKNHHSQLNITLKSQYFNSNDDDNKIAYIVEALITDITDPVKIWNYYNKPSYPNSTIRYAMRSVQGPIVLQQKHLQLKEINGNLKIHLNNTIPLKSPWIILLRICNYQQIHPPFKPYNLRIRNITNGEVMILWNEIYRNDRCLMTYEIYFSKIIKNNWKFITVGQHIPFLSYHFHSDDGITQGLVFVSSFTVDRNFKFFYFLQATIKFVELMYLEEKENSLKLNHFSKN